MTKRAQRVQVTLRPDQIDALRIETAKRMVALSTGKPDAGAIVREALDEWFEKHTRKAGKRT